MKLFIYERSNNRYKINWKVRENIFTREAKSSNISTFENTCRTILQRFLLPVPPFRWSKRRNRIQEKKSNLYHTAKVNLSYYQSTRLTEPILLGIYIFLFFFFFSPNFSSEGIRFPVYRGLIKGRCATRNKVHRDRCFVVGQINWNSRPNLLVSNAKREDL